MNDKMYIVGKIEKSESSGDIVSISDQYVTDINKAREYIFSKEDEYTEYMFYEITPAEGELSFSDINIPMFKVPAVESEYDRNMLYLAKMIAFKAHANQVDKNGTPYIEHPLVVSSKCHSIEAKIVGALHDVIEDTDVTYDDLRKLGFGEDIIEALRCVTKEPGYNSEEYFKRIKANPIAKEVKIQDLLHNMDLNRLVNIQEINKLKSRLYGIELEYLDSKEEYPKEAIEKQEKLIRDYKAGVITSADIAEDLKKANAGHEKTERELKEAFSAMGFI